MISKTRDKFHLFLVGGKNYKSEVKKQIRLLIVITLGFTIAFTWRQTIFDASQAIVQYLAGINDSVTSSILTSTFITIVSLILILIAAHFLKPSPD